MNRAGAGELDPARVLALGAAGSLAEDAARRDVGARLDEREERRDEARLRPRAEERGEEFLDRPLQVRHRDAALDDEPLDLVEDRRVRGVDALVAIDTPRRDHSERRSPLLQLPDLNRRGVRAQEERRGSLAVHEEAVLRVAGGMVGREVQRLEVMAVVLDLRAVGDRVAHTQEDLLDAAPHDRDRMESAPSRAPSGQCDIDLLGRAASLDLALLEVGRQEGDGLFDLSLGGVGPGAESPPLLRRNIPDAGKESRHEPLFPPEVAPLQPFEIRARWDAGGRLRAETIENAVDGIARAVRREA